MKTQLQLNKYYYYYYVSLKHIPHEAIHPSYYMQKVLQSIRALQNCALTSCIKKINQLM
jgi:hypothetical protein